MTIRLRKQRNARNCSARLGLRICVCVCVCVPAYCSVSSALNVLLARVFQWIAFAYNPSSNSLFIYAVGPSGQWSSSTRCLVQPDPLYPRTNLGQPEPPRSPSSGSSNSRPDQLLHEVDAHPVFSLFVQLLGLPLHTFLMLHLPLRAGGTASSRSTNSKCWLRA